MAVFSRQNLIHQTRIRRFQTTLRIRNNKRHFEEGAEKNFFAQIKDLIK